MIKTPRLQSEQPAALRVSLKSGGIGPFVLPDAQHFSLELSSTAGSLLPKFSISRTAIPPALCCA